MKMLLVSRKSQMNVKCPYCSCNYEISKDLLGQPIGSEKLGYGWWLRCYRCHKKWWLKNTFIEETFNAPPRFDRGVAINKISSLRRKKSEVNKISKVWKYILAALTIFLLALGYNHRVVFYNYLENKAQHLIETASSKIVMSEVKYAVQDETITISGNIINGNERSIANIKALKISLFNKSQKVLSWEAALDNIRLLPQQKVPFSVQKKIPDIPAADVRVEVSIL